MARKVQSSLQQSSLPSYKNPPVNEVVFGVRFRTPDDLRIPHIGILWEKFRAEYPIIQHAPPIASAKGEIKIDSATGVPIPRVWFINKPDDQLVQFQPDRFYYNWRRRQSEYPRYSHLIKNFENVLNHIATFFKEFEFGVLEPIEFELTYINHIPKGEGWDTIDDLPKIFSDLVWNYDERRFLPNPQKVAWNVNFLLPDDNGNLIVSLKHAIRTEDKVPLLVLELKTTGIEDSDGKEGIRGWFDLAREWIVRGFTDLTTSEIQEIWEREDHA
jgi:uncharacterized protein (TIGR04255 family)